MTRTVCIQSSDTTQRQGVRASQTPVDANFGEPTGASSKLQGSERLPPELACTFQIVIPK